ncbi:uncharacterized protein LOC107360254 [Tetranychus urticae]|nr:uncharacterized protein LOC107360254 [Tetranychus urticae]
MNAVNPSKRPSPVSIDPLEFLVCKICDKGDVVLNLKICGCLFCISCDGDSRDICISCQSNVFPGIKVSFTKNPRCKYYEHNKCYNIAVYKCKCIQNLLCGSCLDSTHKKKVRGPCVPEVLRPKVTTNHEICQLCKEFYAGFRMTSAPYTKICLNCKTNNNASIDLEIINEEPVMGLNRKLDWNQLYRDYERSCENMSNKIKKIEDELKLSRLVREQEMQKCRDALSELKKFFVERIKQYNRYIAGLESQLENFKKISNILKPDGTIKTILDQLKNEKLALHGEQGKDQIINLLKSCPGKEFTDSIYNHTFKLVQIFVAEEDSRRRYVSYISRPCPADFLSAIISADVRPIYLSVVKPSKVNERLKLSEEIKKHQDKWVRKDHFDVNDIVIVSFGCKDGTKTFKRAKILSKGNDDSTVLLLDFGFQAKVPNSSVGEINGIKINGKPTCFVAQLSEPDEHIFSCMYSGLNKFDGLPKAMQIMYK